MRRRIAIGLLTVVAVAAWLTVASLQSNRRAAEAGNDDVRQPALVAQPVAIPAQYKDGYSGPLSISLPPGFSISLYAQLPISSARGLAVGACGDIIVGTLASKVYRLPDRNHDGVADSVNLFATSSGSEIQHSVEYWGGHYYVGGETEIVRYDQATCDSPASNGFAVIGGLPVGGTHSTRTILHGPDGTIYVAVGASCNACIEADLRRATVLHFDSSLHQSIYAGGLRNSVGLAFRPGTSELWGVDNGVDDPGKDPFDEINRILPNGLYGWPYCYNDGTPDPSWAGLAPKPNYCRDYARSPFAKLETHAAPMQIAMTENSSLTFPTRWKQGLFVAERGSRYNVPCNTPHGYKVSYIPAFAPHGWPAGSNVPVLDFATDPGDDCFHAWRPVGLAIGNDGALYLSVDGQAIPSAVQGAVFRIVYTGSGLTVSRLGLADRSWYKSDAREQELKASLGDAPLWGTPLWGRLVREKSSPSPCPG